MNVLGLISQLIIIETLRLTLLKDLPKPLMPNRTYMRKSILKTGFQYLFGLTRRVGAIERLIQTFDAK